MELVSVIIPVYNVEKYLDRCVKSVINQTYTNLEIILVDDGSTDNSGVLCNEFLQKDDRIIVIHQENKGASAARNTGIQACTGKWIAFIDSDDFIHKEYIETLYHICKKQNVLIAQCGAVRGKDSVFPKDINIAVEERWLFKQLYKSQTRAFRAIVWGKLIKKEIVLKYPFPEGKIFEDEDVVFKYMYEARDCVITNRHLYYYYMSPNSILRNSNKHVKFDYVEIFMERCKFLAARGEDELIQYTNKELCIRLMLGYCSAKKDKLAKKDINELRKIFIRTFKEINWKTNFPAKEILAIHLFYHFPHLFAFIENHFNIIRGVKYRREKK